MPSRLQEARGLLHALHRLKHPQCDVLIKQLDDKNIELLSELVHHLLQGRFPLKSKAKNRLRRQIHPHLKAFQTLTKVPQSAKDLQKKRTVLKRGGVIGALVSIGSVLLPFLTQLLTSSRRYG